MTDMEMQSNKMSITEETQAQTRKECGKRGRKPGRKTSTEKLDIKAKLERSRQSARECRARKKLRYQYLEELVADREKAVVALRTELERLIQWNNQLSESNTPTNNDQLLQELGILKQE
ncbi:REPTOR-binding partner isoform X1 [Drosophila mauritiana]|uniref:REPTOR-binding partner isoform X1 n=1 Tax=Drosophila mauritiana TaxID=7226 RepID=A0A6P8JDY2_DROMA|nr:REPTOR-binding partner isoform X1 [Drosophila mauritiana]